MSFFLPTIVGLQIPILNLLALTTLLQQMNKCLRAWTNGTSHLLQPKSQSPKIRKANQNRHQHTHAPHQRRPTRPAKHAPRPQRMPPASAPTLRRSPLRRGADDLRHADEAQHPRGAQGPHLAGPNSRHRPEHSLRTFGLLQGSVNKKHQRKMGQNETTRTWNRCSSLFGDHRFSSFFHHQDMDHRFSGHFFHLITRAWRHFGVTNYLLTSLAGGLQGKGEEQIHLGIRDAKSPCSSRFS